MSCVTVRDSASTVTSGRVTRARRLNCPGNLRWEMTVQPTAAGDITAGRAGTQLSTSSSATVR